MLVFAGMFHIYRHGRTMSKAPPPPPPSRPVTPPTARPTLVPPQPTPAPSTTGEKPLAPPPVQKASGGQQGKSTPQPQMEAKTPRSSDIQNPNPTDKAGEDY